MGRLRRLLSVLVLAIFFSASAHSTEGGAKKADPAQYREFSKLLKELYALQDPATSSWEAAKTRRMYQILETLQDMKKKGFVLEKTDELLRTLNQLVENMHSHSLVLAVANNPGTVLLRVGKTPANPEFGGLLAEKVSDFDMTVVGKNASRARDLHLSLLNKFYGENFAKMTMTDLALADSTIAAWSLRDIEKAYASAVLNPEMHRTYSGLQFVEDYVLKVGEISQMGEDGKLVTMKLDSFGDEKVPFEIKKQKFIDWANEAFEKSGHKIRFGKRDTDFCLGLVSDISNQMWMNLQKEENQANPHNVVKKYLQRYGDEIQSRMKIDLRKESAYGKVYGELEELIHKCQDKEPGAWGALEKRMAEFEGFIRGTVAEKQAALYAEALAAGKTERAAAILLDTKGALQNFELLGQNTPTGALGKLGAQAAKELAENPLFIEPRNWAKLFGRLKTSVFDLATMEKYLAENKGSVFLRVGGSLFALYDAAQRESEGEKGAFRQAAKWEAFDAVMFNALPLVLDFVEYRAAAATLGIAGGVMGLTEMGYSAYRSYLYATLRAANVEPRILARLAGITPDGKKIEGTDIITALGEPITEEDLAAPSKQPLGEFDGGKFRIWKREDGVFEFERLHPSAEKSWEENEFFIQKNWDKRELWPPVLQTSWEKWALTPAQIISERRLQRVFETLRRQYVSQSPNPGSEKVAAIDTKALAEPFHLDEPLFFEKPVHREEIFYYWKRYNEAFIKSAVQFSDSTSVFRTAGQELEKDLAESALRKFLETMAKLAAQSDAAREAFESADPLTLEAHLASGIKIHFDGRDIPAEQIRGRIDGLRQRALNESASKNAVWLDWVREHLKAAEFPDLRDAEFKLLGVQSAPDGEESYKIVCKYQVSKPMGLRFRLFQKAGGKIYPAYSDYGKLEPAPNEESAAPLTGTANFRVTRNDKGKTETYFLKVVDYSDESKVYAQSSDIQVPGFERVWVFEKFGKIKGPGDYRKERKDWGMVTDFKVKTEGNAVILESRSEDNREISQSWVNRAVIVGPAPPAISSGKLAGMWAQEIATEKKTRDGASMIPIGIELHFLVVEESDKKKDDPVPDRQSKLSLSKISDGAMQEYRKSGFPELRPAQGENAESKAWPIELGGFRPYTERVRLRLHAKVELDNKKQEHVFEWVYRQGKPGEAGAGAPSSGGSAAVDILAAPPSPWLSSVERTKATGGSAGASPTAGNPWKESLQTAEQAGGGGKAALGGAEPNAWLSPQAILSSPNPWAYPQVQAAMDDWLASAKPPINDGMPWRYTEWGVMENGVNVKALHPDNQGMTRYQFLWEKCQRLTSADHCTLGDYIRLRLTRGSLEECKGKMPPAAARREERKPTPEPVKVGEKAPAFESKTLDGRMKVRSQDLKGKVVLFQLWNPDSPEDRQNWKFLEYQMGKEPLLDNGFLVVSTAPHPDGVHPKVFEGMGKKQPFTWEIVPDPSFVEAFRAGTSASLTVFVIDREGVVRGIYPNGIADKKEAMDLVGKLLGPLRLRK